MSETTFGEVIKKARKNKGYSQRELAKLIALDFTYLSKMENNRTDYAPKEDAIRRLAEQLGLDPEELIFLAGRIPSEYQKVLQANYQSMPALFRRIREETSAVLTGEN